MDSILHAHGNNLYGHRYAHANADCVHMDSRHNPKFPSFPAKNVTVPCGSENATLPIDITCIPAWKSCGDAGSSLRWSSNCLFW